MLSPLRFLDLALLALALFATLPALRAHTADTSYAKIAIGREEVAFTFTYDVLTLTRMTGVDANRDGSITRTELLAAAPAIDSFLRHSIYPEINEREAAFGPLDPPTWPADAGEAIAASDFGQRLVALTFRNAVLHAPDSVAVTFDFFGSLGERHTILGNFHWNGQENPVVFTRFEPDYLFDTGYRVPALEQFKQYLVVGIEHIFRGYDHIAFLLALLFVKRFRDLLKVITAFTIAHTLTLALAALGLVALPSRLVESVIAISIVYVAAENIWRHTEGAHRWRIAFGFGLVHGFGFASVLRELGLPSEGLVRSLLAFNLGVEVGQLAIAAACWPVLRWVSRRTWAGRARAVVSWILLLFGAAWLVDRVFALGLMPF
ncbi:MAG: HupE/UreJ family protein [Verrucomicrobiota bacterium]